ncbi:hypothetical protein Tco_0111682 [Tanacetum coccineum]
MDEGSSVSNNHWQSIQICFYKTSTLLGCAHVIRIFIRLGICEPTRGHTLIHLDIILLIVCYALRLFTLATSGRFQYLHGFNTRAYSQEAPVLYLACFAKRYRSVFSTSVGLVYQEEMHVDGTINMDGTINVSDNVHVAATVNASDNVDATMNGSDNVHVELLDMYYEFNAFEDIPSENANDNAATNVSDRETANNKEDDNDFIFDEDNNVEEVNAGNLKVLDNEEFDSSSDEKDGVEKIRRKKL